MKAPIKSLINFNFFCEICNKRSFGSCVQNMVRQSFFIFFAQICYSEEQLLMLTTSNKRSSSYVDVVGHVALAEETQGSTVNSVAGSHYRSTTACSRHQHLPQAPAVGVEMLQYQREEEQILEKRWD